MSDTPVSKIFILSSEDEDCEPCAEVKDALVGRTDVQILDINSQEAIELLKRANYEAAEKLEIPMAVVEEIDGRCSICQLFGEKGLLLAQCGERMIPIVDDEDDSGS